MKLTTKQRLVIIKIFTALAMITVFLSNVSAVFATGGSTGIGTAEVTAATENIKRVITSIAMPLRWSTYLCKYSNRSNKDDSKR